MNFTNDELHKLKQILNLFKKTNALDTLIQGSNITLSRNKCGQTVISSSAGGSNLPIEVENALLNANTPSGANPYATLSDIPTSSDITVVANYSALPNPTTVGGEFYWVSNSQGTKWLPGSLGGTYYSKGLYYSNSVSWEYIETPYQATQLEVDAGINDDKFVTPLSLNNYSGWNKTKIGLDNVVNLDTSTTSNITDSTDKRFVTDVNLAVISNTSGINSGDNAVNSLYSGLVSNATHTGEVTGAITLTLDKTAITNKTTVTVANDDYVLISDTSDSGNLKKALKSDFGGGGSSSSLSGLTDATSTSTLANGTNIITWNWSGLTAGTKGLIFGGTDIVINGMTIGLGKNQSTSNVVLGSNALAASTSGLYNTAIGSNALNKLTIGLANTAIGDTALGSLTTGQNNIGIGRQALTATLDGQGNIGIGNFALTTMLQAYNNTAIGQNALYNNILGYSNTAIGNSAFINVKGGNNTGVGKDVGYNLTTGTTNTIIGYLTGLGITTGSKNTIIGANVSGLATSLSNTIILAEGDGVIRYYCNSAGSTGIGTTSPSASAKLDVSSTTQGVLLPRMTTTQKNAIASPTEGLEVYDLTLKKKCFYNGTAWETITSI